MQVQRNYPSRGGIRDYGTAISARVSRQGAAKQSSSSGRIPRELRMLRAGGPFREAKQQQSKAAQGNRSGESPLVKELGAQAGGTEFSSDPGHYPKNCKH